ncbi:MAG TPA: inositol monophosphatase family protein [Thermoflexales bacterium]|nr:inositol monophosphatase family protein [Thermoflexales bacterium]HQW36451.1 inositol monophosphatase family protein [Thermoflexales bacterium]HQX74699.1 inositol monophosphatase family protein [Thermoflexales bacterium]HQZ22996.1 inositol monophosphatase family protein [Thermoflexales bacterium]HQZ99981.1 inositol monophosphatase family protein [Thermoflexales bacterium]
MNLDVFWQHIFSEDRGQILEAWKSISPEEKQPVRDLLAAILDDPERVIEQRNAARFALQVVDGALGGYDLPDGALAFARDLARDTAQLLVANFGRLIATKKKDDTLVTESDLESDKRIVSAIRQKYPQHGILSEESAKVFNGEEWCWVIDPIDGTTNFTWGFPVWGVLIGLLHNGEPVMGVADFPMTSEHYYAVKNGGSFCNDAPIYSSDAERMDASQVFACCTRTLKKGRPDVPMRIRVAGSTGFDLAMLACGASIGTMGMTVHVWDVAALWPIMLEAGAALATSAHAFPLAPGADLSAISFSVLGGSSPDMLAELKGRLSDRFTPASE